MVQKLPSSSHDAPTNQLPANPPPTSEVMAAGMEHLPLAQPEELPQTIRKLQAQLLAQQEELAKLRAEADRASQPKPEIPTQAQVNSFFPPPSQTQTEDLT